MKATLMYMKINELNLKTHLDFEILSQQNRFETEANDNLEITFSHSDISQYYFIT